VLPSILPLFSSLIRAQQGSSRRRASVSSKDDFATPAKDADKQRKKSHLVCTCLDKFTRDHAATLRQLSLCHATSRMVKVLAATLQYPRHAQVFSLFWVFSNIASRYWWRMGWLLLFPSLHRFPYGFRLQMTRQRQLRFDCVARNLRMLNRN